MIYLPWNLAQRDRFGKSTERNFSWEDVEIDSIKEKKNNLKRVVPIPIVSQENVHAKPQQLPPDLAVVVEAWSQLPDAIRLAIVAIVRSSNEE